MAKVIGIVNLHEDVNYAELTERRPAASVSFLGRYAIVDFVLSNLSNSGIDKVGVLVQNKPRSIIKHLGGGTSWNLNQKRGGLSILYNEKYAGTAKYNHDLNNLVENIAFLKASKADIAVIAPSHIINTLNYADVVEAHEKSGAEITMVYSKINNAKEAFIGNDVLKVKDGKVEAIDINRGTAKNRDVSLDTYVINVSTLEEIMKNAKKVSAFFSLKDMLKYLLDEKVIYAYQYKGYVRNIDSLEAYFATSIELIDVVNNSQVFKSNWPIYTNTNDTPPTKYLKNSSVVSSFVSNGAVVDGTVENSIIGREVKVGKGAVVKNSIILTGSVIEAGAVLENVIVDKNATVTKKNELKGSPDKPLLIKEGDRV